ncbi:unnamed protein product [Schistosoma mattheei]|uniref:Helix-turn-helix domain-containing protein n=1 Tax=Schistosoma mattheei TaxID=31246 RepID=A0AA85BNJ4_9TREM|nr:unnamed protein product [Schistosoma mattheei]
MLFWTGQSISLQDKSLSLQFIRKTYGMVVISISIAFVRSVTKRHWSKHFHRTERIYTSDTLEEEVMNVKKCLKNNGYPLKFIEKCGKREDKKPKEITANKKPIFIQLQFKGDDITGSINMMGALLMMFLITLRMLIS